MGGLSIRIFFNRIFNLIFILIEKDIFYLFLVLLNLKPKYVNCVYSIFPVIKHIHLVQYSHNQVRITQVM